MNKSIILAFLIALSSVCGAQKNNQLIDRIEATVGGEILLSSDIETQKIQLESQGMVPGANVNCLVAEELLLQKLLVNQAKIDSLEASEIEIQTELSRRLEYFISLVGSESEFESYYGKSIPQFKSEFEGQIREQMLAQKMQQEVFIDVNVTPGDVTKYFKEIPKDSLPLINAQVQYSEIKMEPTVRPEQITQLKTTLDSIKMELKAGNMLWSTAAIRYSEDPGSRVRGGKYENIKRGSFVPEFEQAVFSTEEGGYSKIFQTSYGYHFLKVLEKRGEYFSIRHVLMTPKIFPNDLERMKLKLDTLQNLMQSDTILFGDMAFKYSTDKDAANQKGQVINPRTNSLDWEEGQLDPQIFFALSKLKPGEVSDPIRIETEEGRMHYSLFRLDKRTDAHKANMTQDYGLIKSSTESQLREQALDAWVKDHVAKTFVHLHEDWRSCDLKYDWFKTNP